MVMTCNIRNEVLSYLKDDPDFAVQKFAGMIRRSVRRARNLKPFSAPARNYNFTAAVIGDGESALESAQALADAGIDVFLFGSREKPLGDVPHHPNLLAFAGSRTLGVSGSLGAFQGPEAAQGFLHNYSGLIVFVVAFVLVYGVHAMMHAIERNLEKRT